LAACTASIDNVRIVLTVNCSIVSVLPSVMSVLLGNSKSSDEGNAEYEICVASAWCNDRFGHTPVAEHRVAIGRLAVSDGITGRQREPGFVDRGTYMA
jgi:hypothetical protein